MSSSDASSFLASLRNLRGPVRRPTRDHARPPGMDADLAGDFVEEDDQVVEGEVESEVIEDEELDAEVDENTPLRGDLLPVRKSRRRRSRTRTTLRTVSQRYGSVTGYDEDEEDRMACLSCSVRVLLLRSCAIPKLTVP